MRDPCAGDLGALAGGLRVAAELELEFEFEFEFELPSCFTISSSRMACRVLRFWRSSSSLVRARTEDRGGRPRPRRWEEDDDLVSWGADGSRCDSSRERARAEEGGGRPRRLEDEVVSWGLLDGIGENENNLECWVNRELEILRSEVEIAVDLFCRFS